VCNGHINATPYFVRQTIFGMRRNKVGVKIVSNPDVPLSFSEE